MSADFSQLAEKVSEAQAQAGRGIRKAEGYSENGFEGAPPGYGAFAVNEFSR